MPKSEPDLSPEWAYALHILRTQPGARLITNPDGSWTLEHTVACNMPTAHKIITSLK